MSKSTLYPKNYKQLRAMKGVPIVSIDHESFFTYVSPEFKDAYGWSSDELLGKTVTTIMPEHMRNIHIVGFSRFLVTEEKRVIGKPVEVSVLCKDDRSVPVMLYILGQKNDDVWQFTAMINPVTD